MNKTEAKKIVSIVLNVLVWAFLVFATLVTILTFVSMNAKDGVPSLFGKSFVSVLTPSMDGDQKDSFKQGDLLIVTKISDKEAFSLQEGTIVVYRAHHDRDGDGEKDEYINTHRIVERIEENETVRYQTKGDAEANQDPYKLHYTDIIAVYNGHRVKGFGSVVDFLKSSMGFLLVVVLPMALFFIYEVYNLIKILMEQKLKKATATVSAETEEEIKRRAIEEFLAQQAAANAASTPAETATENTENDQK